MDKDGDGKISYEAYGEGSISVKAIEEANKLLATDKYKIGVSLFKKVNTSIVYYNTENTLGYSSDFNANLDSVIESKVEFIVTEDDALACSLLQALQAKGYNADKLVTHFIPVFTVGEEVDYKSLVLLGRPEIPDNLKIKDTDSKEEIKSKNKEIKKLDKLQEYYENNKNLVDLTNVNESDLDEMIYTTVNVIDAGRLSGTATADADGIAAIVAEITRNFVKGNSVFKNVDSKLVKDRVVNVPYTVYPN